MNIHMDDVIEYFQGTLNANTEINLMRHTENQLNFFELC